MEPAGSPKGSSAAVPTSAASLGILLLFFPNCSGNPKASHHLLLHECPQVLARHQELALHQQELSTRRKLLAPGVGHELPRRGERRQKGI